MLSIIACDTDERAAPDPATGNELSKEGLSGAVRRSGWNDSEPPPGSDKVVLKKDDRRIVITARSFALLSALIFAVIAVMQVMRALLGWSVTVDVGGGPVSIPFWPNWIAFAVCALLSWLGFTASRYREGRADEA